MHLQRICAVKIFITKFDLIVAFPFYYNNIFSKSLFCYYKVIFLKFFHLQWIRAVTNVIKIYIFKIIAFPMNSCKLIWKIEFSDSSNFFLLHKYYIQIFAFAIIFRKPVKFFFISFYLYEEIYKIIYFKCNLKLFRKKKKKRKIFLFKFLTV